MVKEEHMEVGMVLVRELVEVLGVVLELPVVMEKAVEAALVAVVLDSRDTMLDTVVVIMMVAVTLKTLDLQYFLKRMRL